MEHPSLQNSSTSTPLACLKAIPLADPYSLCLAVATPMIFGVPLRIYQKLHRKHLSTVLDSHWERMCWRSIWGRKENRPRSKLGSSWELLGLVLLAIDLFQWRRMLSSVYVPGLHNWPRSSLFDVPPLDLLAGNGFQLTSSRHSSQETNRNRR